MSYTVKGKGLIKTVDLTELEKMKKALDHLAENGTREVAEHLQIKTTEAVKRAYFRTHTRRS